MAQVKVGDQKIGFLEAYSSSLFTTTKLRLSFSYCLQSNIKTF